MPTAIFDQIKSMVEEGSWGPDKAKDLGFDYADSKEVHQEFEVVIMGAGPGGFGFAKSAIDSGQMKPDPDSPPIMVLESGSKIGVKSVYGGVFWPNDPPIFENDRDFFDDCPFDRKVARHRDNMLFVDHEGRKFKPPLLEPARLFRNDTLGYMTPKSVLYPYFWQKLETERKKGYFKIRTSQPADKLILNERGKVIGCLTSTGQKYFAKVVIDSTGNGARFSKHLSVRPLNNHHGDFFFGVKLVCKLDNASINAMYDLNDDNEGCVVELGGQISDRIKALPGIVGIYPGDGVINVSVLYSPTYGYKSGLQPHDIMNEVLKNPVVKKLTVGAEPVEWSACGLPELHFKSMPNWVADGYIPVGDTLGLVDFLRKHGVNTAMKSGSIAAEVVTELLASDTEMLGDHLGKYKTLLEKSWIGSRIMSFSFDIIHRAINLDIAYKAMTLPGRLGKKLDNVPDTAVPPMPLPDYMALNSEPKGQPEIIIADLNVCASCVSEACVTSDPCQAFTFNKSGIPVIDVDPVDRDQVKEMQTSLSRYKTVNAEGCLECSNCANACPYGNVIYSMPTHVKGKHDVKNQGIVYKYN